MAQRSRLIWLGREVSEEVRQACVGIVANAAEFVLQEANKTVPLDEGTLAGSGTVSVDEALLAAAVSYDTPYAIRQHEDTRLRHAPGRRAKWLQLTLAEQRTRVLSYMRNQLRQVLGK